jgi:hypothetical protein
MNLSDFDFKEIKLDGKYKKYIDGNAEIIKKYKKYFDKLNLTGASTILYKYF